VAQDHALAPYTSCHTLRRVLVRLPIKVAGQEWTIRVCGMPLFSDLGDAQEYLLRIHPARAAVAFA